MRRWGREEILVVGDSHAEVFEDPMFRQAFPQYYFHCVVVPGATISGLTNPKSKTQAMPIFRKEMERSSARKSIVLLGEVDTGFVIWYRAEKYRLSVDEMFERALENYRNFLGELSERFETVCVSTPLPTIVDDQDWGEVANLRKEIRATQRERTDLTLEFNRRMEEYCRERSIAYLSLDEESLGADGVVKRELLNRNPTNHHYDRERYASMLIRGLRQLPTWENSFSERPI